MAHQLPQQEGEGRTLNPEARDFVEKFGLQVEREGLGRSAGRIGAYLLLQERPRSLEEIARDLQISRASVSTNARFLERTGAVERVGFPGDRRDYYRTVEDFPGAMIVVWRRRFMEALDLLERTLDELPEDEEPGRTRVARLREFYRSMTEQLEGLHQKWTDESGDRTAPS